MAQRAESANDYYLQEWNTYFLKFAHDPDFPKGIDKRNIDNIIANFGFDRKLLAQFESPSQYSSWLDRPVRLYKLGCGKCFCKTLPV